MKITAWNFENRIFQFSFKVFEFLFEFEKMMFSCRREHRAKKTSADCWLSLALRVSLSGPQILRKTQLSLWTSRTISLTERLIVKVQIFPQNFITLCIKSFTFCSLATGKWKIFCSRQYFFLILVLFLTEQVTEFEGMTTSPNLGSGQCQTMSPCVCLHEAI